jgi:CubicO group peptidase (beta-lactamase class C family)
VNTFQDFKTRKKSQFTPTDFSFIEFCKMSSVQMSSLATEASRIINEAMHDTAIPPVPGIAFQCVSRTGEILANVNVGKSSILDDEARGLDDKSVFWIASGTKIITAVAFMQLVERGRARLDDADQVDEVLPELKSLKVLQGFTNEGDPILVEQKHRITLRMLITHRGV